MRISGRGRQFVDTKMLLSVLILIAVLSGKSLATEPLAAHLKPSTDDVEAAPSKKNLVQFKRMTECATGRSAFDYIDYGCWCGMGGAGKVVDAVDRCCKIHDKCYGRISRSKVCGWPYRWSTYFRTYKRKKNECTGCAPRKAYRSRKGANCKYPLCMCDSEAAKCFARSKYNRKHYNYDQRKCKKRRRG